MSQTQSLIPSPPVVRERLAQHIREGRLLRALYRLSIRAANEQTPKTSESGITESKGGTR